MEKRKLEKQINLYFIFIIALYCFLLGLHGQQKLPEPEKHEVEVRLVLVDVIVTKDGKFVTDLNMNDFELYEDGEIVPINSFELISFGERETLAVEEETEEIPPEATKKDIPEKQLVVVFDGISSWKRNLKEGSRKIVDELVSLAKLGNEVMVIQLSENKGIEILQPFTTEEKLIRKALIKSSGSIWFDRSLDGIKMLQEVGIEDVGPMAQVERYAEGLQPLLEQEYLYAERGRFEKALGGLLAVTNMIRDLPGRKTILLISDGFPDISGKTLDSIITETTPKHIVSGARSPHLDIRKDTGKIRVFDPFNILGKKKIMSGEEAIREFIRFANAQNISVYSLDPEAFTKDLVLVSAERGPRDEMMQIIKWRTEDKISRIQNLRWLSEDTGGVSLRGAKRYDKFYKVMRTDLNYYYQLSYYPPRGKPDDQYHKIDVKVKRSGVDVRHRRGYTDYSEEGEEKMLLVSAYYNPSLFKSLPIEAQFIAFYKNEKKYEPWMNIALPTKELFMRRGISPGFKVFNLHIWVKDKERGEKAFSGQIPIPFNIDSSFVDMVKSTDYLVFHYKGPEMDIPQKEYQAIFALYDEQTNELGTWEGSLVPPEFKEGKGGGIANCVLGSVASSSKKGRKSFSISKEDGSMEYGEIKFFPAVTNRFQRMQDPSVFIQVYLPQGKVKVSPEFTVSREGGILQRIPAELIAETWNKKSKILSGIFNLDLSIAFPGEYMFRVEIPVSEEGPILTKEVKLIKLAY